MARRIAAVALLALGIAACSSAAPSAEPSRRLTSVAFVGDSLGEQTAPYLQPLVAPLAFTAYVYGGTAPCDWLRKDIALAKESVLVLQFTGNSLTPCIEDGGGAHLSGQALVDRYRADITTLTVHARDVGAAVLLVGQPVRAPGVPGNDEVDGLNTMYAALADDLGFHFVDAGAAIEHADGSYAATLPCLPGEQACDPSGSNVVRNDDGLHLCPGPPDPVPCAVYSSGAFRFASAIAGAIDDLR